MPSKKMRLQKDNVSIWVPGPVMGQHTTYIRSSMQGPQTLDVRLDDQVPSAERLYNDVDIVVWGLVELVSIEARQAAAALAAARPSVLSEDEAMMTTLGLPLTLGKRSNLETGIPSSTLVTVGKKRAKNQLQQPQAGSLLNAAEWSVRIKLPQPYSLTERGGEARAGLVTGMFGV